MRAASELPKANPLRESRRRSDAIAGWVRFGGCVLVVAILYWAQALLVPIAIAGLLAFLLAPAAGALERPIGRVPSVLGVVALTTAILGLAGWGLVHQATGIVDELPQYRVNIRHKIADIRGVGQSGTVDKLQKTVDDIKSDMAGPEAERGAAARPVVVASDQVNALWDLTGWVGPVLAPLATAGLVLVLVIFILLERQDLRNRLVGLFGHGTLAVTTKAFDEAASRVSRYLSRMSLINLLFACGVAAGLALIGVPYALLLAALAGVLRFIPYVGIWIAAGMPLVVALATLPGWEPAVMVIGLFVAIEIVTTVVLETVLYADAAGISQVALLIAVAFWAWLWGAPGLLLATPLTVCLVVLGKHVPGLDFVATLMADVPPLGPDVLGYQRLLARDYAEAAGLVEEQAREHPAETVFDALLVPALAYAERDRVEGRLSPEDARDVLDATRELLRDGAALVRAEARPTAATALPPQRIFGLAIEPDTGALTLEMLRVVLDGTPLAVDAAPPELLPSEVVTFVSDGTYRIVCIADLAPRSPSKARYLVKKLRTALPELAIVVGRWGPPALRDESPQPLLDAGATAVTATLLETREQLVKLAAAASGVEAPADPNVVEPARARPLDRVDEATGTG